MDSWLPHLESAGPAIQRATHGHITLLLQITHAVGLVRAVWSETSMPVKDTALSTSCGLTDLLLASPCTAVVLWGFFSGRLLLPLLLESRLG